MFRADCIGVRRKGNLIEAQVRFFDERPAAPKRLFDEAFTGATKDVIKAGVDVVLERLKAAEDDATLNKEFVGQTISRI